MSHWESTGESDLWQTPAYIFDALGERFDLDPAHPIERLYVPCDRFFCDRGIEREWDGFVWLNAPFGGRNGLNPWMRKFMAHGNGVALVPDRTSAPWFQEAAAIAEMVLFISPKVKFVRPDGSLGTSPSTGTALFAAGARGCAALMRARNLGFLCIGIGRARLRVEG